MQVSNNINDRLTASQRKSLQRYKEQILRVAKAIRRYPSAMAGLVIIVSFFLMAIFAPVIAPYDPMKIHHLANGATNDLSPPTRAHLFGTNHLGRDIFSQWIYGVRVSLLVGFLSGLIILAIGGSVGLISGYYKGTTDVVMMRIVDVLYGIPTEPLILIIALVFGSSVWNIIFAMGLILWRSMARIVRSQALSLSERPFIKAARAAGAGDIRIIYLHMAPNLLPLMLIETTLVIAWAIIVEAGMSFLGFGAQEMVSWGTMLQATFSTGAISFAWWWVFPPGLSITVLVTSFYFVARALEDITNPEAGQVGGVS